MYSKKNILLVGLLFVAAFCHAQNDSLEKKDTSSIKTDLYKSYVLNSKINFYDGHFKPDYHNFYQADKYKLIDFNPFFIGSPFEYFPHDNYVQYSLRYNFYNKYNPLNPSNYQPNQNNPWYDPTNPIGATTVGEALILGSLNYLFLIVLTAE